MIETVTTWDEFREKWMGGERRQNFLLKGEMFPFRFEAPPLETVVDAVRRHKDARILHGDPDNLNLNLPYEGYVDLPIAQAIAAPANVAHFESREFAGPGQVLEGLNETFDAWYDLLASHGFTHAKGQRAFFYSGANCGSAYHFDSSYVLVCQVVGRKRFCWLKDPDRWCPRETLVEQMDYYNKMRRPEGITPDDVIECEMEPGDVLWNVMLTPHWVYALDEPTYSFNLTHFDLQCDGVKPAIQEFYEEVSRGRMAAAA